MTNMMSALMNGIKLSLHAARELAPRYAKQTTGAYTLRTKDWVVSKLILRTFFDEVYRFESLFAVLRVG